MTEAKTTTVLNGESPQSTTLRHLLTLPAVQDGVRVFKANPLGNMSIQLGYSAYNMVGAPMVSLFNKPLSYVTPYVQRVDQYGDQTLSRVEEKYPMVKKPSPELLSDAKQAVYAPVRHVTEVYNGTLQRTGGMYVVASGKAAAKTVVVVSVEGAVFALREAMNLTDSLQIRDSLKKVVSQLEAVVNRHNMAGNNANHVAQPQDAAAKVTGA
ncbi:hypothetical protein N658DRAFT_495933 [Parathielavia hyrcaniae]|uniref:Uncharacterized protein n=1 Tax=Parathielavia hyrcaniae TaxID=113614 RepID=A0AAN6Q1R8_9PEZI|nr:hypothetical protein N658DRAFT_495933 [Parathielavia hyrcaniae]